MKIETEADVNVTRLDKRGPMEFVELRPDAPEVVSITLSSALNLFKDHTRARITVDKNGKRVKITIEQGAE